MKSKLIQLVPVVVSALGLLFAPFSYWCVYSTTGYCRATWLNQIYQYFTNPLYNFSVYFLLIAIALVFVPRPVFNAWLKFALWALPLSFIFIAATPVSFSGPIDFLPFYRDDAARLWGAIFAVASLVVLAFGFARARLSAGSDGGSDQEARELKAVFIAGAGLISAVAASWMMYALIRGALDAFLVTGAISIVSGLYAFGYAGILSYKRRKSRTPLGWKLILALLLSSASSIGLIIALIIDFLYA